MHNESVKFSLLGRQNNNTFLNFLPIFYNVFKTFKREYMLNLTWFRLDLKNWSDLTWT